MDGRAQLHAHADEEPREESPSNYSPGDTKLTFEPDQLQGFKYFKMLGPLLKRLHGVGAERDKAGKRTLHFDYYCTLILFYFFNPVLDGLRAIQQVSTLKDVQEKLGIERTSLGSLSEARSVFDAALLKPILNELARRLGPLRRGREAEALHNLTAVDGSLFRALPKMVWALWNYEDKKAVRLHLHFEVMRAAPIAAEVTHGKYCEKKVLRRMIEAGRLYVMDRGYEAFRLFQAIVDAHSSFICAVRDQMTWTLVRALPLSAADRAARVVFDAEVWLGGKKAKGVLKQTYRVVQIDLGKTDEAGRPRVMTLITDRMDLPAELIALAYHYRWQIELYFRWLKCVLGCRHLLHLNHNGVQLQVYLALIASLLISLWVECKPTKRTYEMLCFYFMGLASLEELTQHIEQLKAKQAAKQRVS
jgi:hypothetical protein